MFASLNLNPQKHLNNFQSCPAVGPLIFSPIKGILSVFQIISGLAIAVFFSIGFLASGCTNHWIDYAVKGMIDVNLGWMHLAYSILNLITLGMASGIARGMGSIVECFC